MGKIRLKTIGDEEQEEQDKKKSETRRAEKLARLSATASPLAEPARQSPDGSSRMADGQSEADREVADDGGQARETASEATEQTEHPQSPEPAAIKKKAKFVKTKKRSANYSAKVIEIDKNKTYSLPEGLELLKKVHLAKFDETVELHINTTEAGISGQVKLPHGTGKEVRVAVASDELLNKIESGKIDFDILIAPPAMMPKLARVAKVLGPKGLMPNPKNGTISENPQEAMKKFQGGQVSFKTESKVPVMHLTVGKMSFGDEKLSENIDTMVKAIKKDRITKVTLKSTMSPGIRIQI